MINIDICEAYHFLYDGTIEPYREIIVKGGRGGGKTYNMVDFILIKTIEEQCTSLCLREFSTTNKHSLLAEFRNVINKHNLEVKMKDIIFNLPKNEKFVKITATEISFYNNRGKILFSGINDNTAMSLKSMSNIKYCWIDEASFLTEYSHRILKPTIRAKNSKIFYTFNPQSEEDFIYQKSLQDDPLTLVKTINYSDIPFFPSVLEIDRQNDFNTLPRDLYKHIWEGQPLNYNEMPVINVERIGRFDDTIYHEYVNLILSIDTATSIKTGADYSVVGCLGLTKDNDYHLVHLARGHWDWHTLINKIVDVYHLSQKITQQAPQHILIEAKANGHNVIQELTRTTSLNVIPVTPISDKLSRVVNSMLPFLDKFKIPLNTDNPFNFWIPEYLYELKMFKADNTHKHDDMVDMTSQGLDFLAGSSIDFAKIAEVFQSFSKRGRLNV